MIRNQLSSLELCAGAGGQALGLEQAGFGHQGLVEINSHSCSTLRLNRPEWRVFEKDLHLFAEQDAANFKGIELLAAGLPSVRRFPWLASSLGIKTNGIYSL